MKLTIKLLLVFGFAISIDLQAETAFTYQGQLSRAGQPADGQYDMTFELYDALAAGQQVGVTLNQNNVEVTAGVFDVLLDFGDAPFNNAPRWLEIEVREAGGGNYTVLSPRQRVGASPFAIETLFVAPGAVDTAAIQNGAVTEGKIADEAITLGKIDNGAVVSGSIANGEVKTVDIDGGAITRAKIGDDAVGSGQIEDGSILPADIPGGFLLTSKNQYYTVVGDPVNVAGQAAVDATATCQDDNDIPVAFACEVITTLHNVLLRGSELTDWDTDQQAAAAICSFKNTSTQLGADVRTTLTCVAVP